MDAILDIRLWSAGAGAALGEYLGSFDSLLYALVAFIVTDYITGVLCAIVEKRLSSSVGFKGICQKVCIMALVGVANVLDVNMVGGGCVLRTAVIFFYCANEGKLVCICAPEDASGLLETMKRCPEGQDAAVIGHVTEDAAGRVVMRTALGGRRILQKLAGAQLPRIC